MRRVLFVLIVAAAIAALAIREYRIHNEAPLEEAFIGSDGATVWNSTAAIRSPIGKLNYGQHVFVYQREARESLVSTHSGIRGWVSSASLMDAELWRTALDLAQKTNDMPVQATGHTIARANLHTMPGIRASVILQAPADSPLTVLRHSALVSGSEALASSGGSSVENWWLVRTKLKATGSVAGWVLGRLITLDLPSVLAEYQSSEDMKVVAWFELDHVRDVRSGRIRPEYLVAGIRGRPVGCDFTLLRVYTWSSARERYETAFMDSNVCGKLPVEVTLAKSGLQDAYFRFMDITPSGTEERAYRMRLTTVRRMNPETAAGKGAGKTSASQKDRS